MSTKKASIANRAFVDFSEKAATSPSHAVEKRIQTGPGLMTSFLAKDSEAMRENEELRKEVQKWDGAILTRKIDPKLIETSRWANRHESNFVGPEFDEFKDEIGKAGGNVQPIKVRPLPVSGEEPQRYEIVFGHRRHRACLELGLEVLAIIESLTNEALFIEMDRENRQRKDLRPYEIGLMYAKALDEGLFSSARKLSEKVGIDQSQLNKAISLARMPEAILKAFASPLDLQYRWVADLTSAVSKDPDFVLDLAKSIQNESPRPSSSNVFKRLTAGRGTVPHPSKKNELLEGKSGQKGRLVFNNKKRSVRIDLENIDPARFLEVKSAIKSLLG